MRQTQRTFRSVLSPVLVGLQALALASCEPTQPLLVQPPSASRGEQPNAKASQNGVHFITIATTDSSLAKGQQVQATAVARQADGTPMTQANVAWSISPTTVATISETGLITGGSTAGTATVSATAVGVTSSLTITVAATSATSTSAPVHMVSITANATTLKVGEVTQVTAVARDIQGTPLPDQSITWSTSPTSVATVVASGTTSGVLTAKSAGTATLYAKADSVTSSITVTVVDSGATTATAPVGNVPTGGSYGSATAAELPRLSVATAYPTPSRQVRVPAGASLQDAINAAQPGDELLLAPGATYVGNFLLPNKGATSSWIVIRTDLSDAAIGAAGTRMTPSRASSANLAKILTPNIYSTITTNLGANHYRFTGVEIGATASVAGMNVIVRFGENSTAQNSAATTANNLILDRTYVHGSSTMQLNRCVMLNSATTAVVDSWLGDCHANGGESQAIVGWNGPGPYLIQNNHLEAGHEVIMFGGGSVTILNQSPSDITVRGNHITRPVAWKGVWQVKNLIETKHARRVLIEGNVIENTWADAQAGFAFVMKSEDQNWDTPWTQSTDITIRYNRIRNVGNGFNIAANPSGAPAVPAARFVITDNVLENVNVGSFTGEGRSFQLIGGLADIVLMHNTVVSASGYTSSATTFASLPVVQRLVVHSNVLHHGAYGIKGDNVGEGTPTLTTYATGFLTTNNAIANGGVASSYPANNFFPATLGSIGFVDLANGNYRLSASSAYVGKGYDGRDIGADIDQVDAKTRNAVVAP
jgi:hypothetical protein